MTPVSVACVMGININAQRAVRVHVHMAAMSLTIDNRGEQAPEQASTPRDGVLEDWPRPRGYLEDKILWPWPWPWPRRCAALALASRSGRKTLNF